MLHRCGARASLLWPPCLAHDIRGPSAAGALPTHSVVQGGAQQAVAAHAAHDDEEVMAAADEQAQERQRHGTAGARHQRVRLHVVHRHILQAVRHRQLPRLLHADLQWQAHGWVAIVLLSWTCMTNGRRLLDDRDGS